MKSLSLIPLCLCLTVTAGVSLVGCGGQNFINTNDRLRAQRLKLKRQIQTLEHKLSLREGQINSMRQQLSAGHTKPPKGATPPRLSKFVMGRYTAAVDTDDDGRDDVVRLYLRTLDQNGRFLPVSAKAVVQVVAIEENQKPRLLAERQYNYPQFDNAYRSNFTGTHYVLQASLPKSLPANLREATVKVMLQDAATGAKFTAQRAVRIQH